MEQGWVKWGLPWQWGWGRHSTEQCCGAGLIQPSTSSPPGPCAACTKEGTPVCGQELLVFCHTGLLSLSHLPPHCTMQPDWFFWPLCPLWPLCLLWPLGAALQRRAGPFPWECHRFQVSEHNKPAAATALKLRSWCQQPVSSPRLGSSGH